MYKKITHNIVEEHFEHPALAHAAIEATNNAKVIDHRPKAAGDLESAIKFRLLAQRLWSDQAWWTRELLVAVLNGLDPAQNELKLIANAVNLGNAIKPFYGEEVSKTFTTKIEELDRSLIDYVKAVKANRPTDDLKKKAEKSISDIADFLSGINPTHWPRTAVFDLLNLYLALILEKIAAIHRKDWVVERDTSNKAKEAVAKISDAFAKGIVAQFPDKFFY